MKKRTESQLTTACLKFLRTKENLGQIIYCDRLNSGVIFAKRGPTIQKIKLCRSGTPDIYAILPTGSILWIENKVGRGKLSNEQKVFAERLSELNNHYFIVVRKVSELEEFLCELEKSA